jgi:L-lactate utilization protein LutB
MNDKAQMRAIADARGINKNKEEVNNKKNNKVKKIDLNEMSKKVEKIGRHFYINEELDDWLNTVARRTVHTKSDLIEIAIQMLKENSKY